MIDAPAQWQTILAVAFVIRTTVEIVRHWRTINAAILGVALMMVLYFGVDPVVLLGWKFNASAWGAAYVKAIFNTLLLAGATMSGHDLLKRGGTSNAVGSNSGTNH